MKRSTTRETSCKPPSKEIRCRSKGCRYVKSKGRRPVRSEESSPKDDSSDRYTEETDEDVKGRGCEHWTNSDWNAFLRARHREDTRGVTHHPQNQTPRGHKKDKNTQKNLISPTPSFLPPTTRRGLITHLKNTMPSCGVYWASAEKTKGCGHHHEKDVLCFHHHLQETSNACSNNTGKVQYLPTHVDCHVSRRCHMHAPEDVAEVSSAEGNIYWPNSMQDCVELKVETPQSLSAEDQINECHKSSRTDQVVNKASMGEPIESEKELLVHDSFPKRMSADEAAAKKSTGKTREKLVYVVEEEGNDTTKMETDLFSVNEILTIKKDLLELSEFAKKLKKLKEMKNQEDKSKKNGKVCNCQPVTELLSDVNRRIEALEARQEELELARSSKQVACQNDSLTLNLTYPLEGRPHTSGTNNPSVDVTQFKPNNPDLIVSRAEGFPNNSEIVNELLDIKSQLQKLEQRKMSRESSSRAVQNFSQTETAGKKGHSIAVFSSRTYILASPKNLKKGKYDRNASKSANHKPEPQVMADESGNCFAPEDGKKSKTKTEKTKENVSNWLRNVPCDSTAGCPEFGVYTATDVRKGKAKEKESLVGQSAKCKKSSKESGESDFVIQELKNNRESEGCAGTNGNGGESDVPGIPRHRTEVDDEFLCKECILTSSGRLIAYGEKSDPRSTGNSSARRSGLITNTLISLLQRSSSSHSVPSSAGRQDNTKRLHNGKDSSKHGDRNSTNLSSPLSKSMHELSGSGNPDKTAKTIRNTTTKRNAASCFSHPKESKDSKNELVKKSEGSSNNRKSTEIGDTPPVAASSHSYLVDEINLDDGDDEYVTNKKDGISAQVFSTTAAVQGGFDCNTQYERDPKKSRRKTEKECKEKCKTRAKDGKKKPGKECMHKLSKDEKKLMKEMIKYNKKYEKKLAKKEKKCVAKAKKCKKSSSPSISDTVDSLELPSNENKRRVPRCDYHFRSKNVFRNPDKQQQKWRWEVSENPAMVSCSNSCESCLRRENPQPEPVFCPPKPIVVPPRPVVPPQPPCSPENNQKEICGLGSFFKNIRRLYPRCSYLKFFPTKYTDTRATRGKGQTVDSTYPREREKPSRTYYREPDNTARCPPPPYPVEEPYKTSCRECKRNVNCYRVFQMRSGENQGYGDNLEEAQTSESTEDPSTETGTSDECKKYRSTESEEGSTNTSEKIRRIRPDTEFMFPYPRSQVYCMELSKEEKKCQKRLEKRIRKMEKKRRQEKKRCKKMQRKEEKEERKAEKRERKEEKRERREERKEEKRERKEEEKERKERKKEREKERKEEIKRKKRCICIVCGDEHKKKKDGKKCKGKKMDDCDHHGSPSDTTADVDISSCEEPRKNKCVEEQPRERMPSKRECIDQPHRKKCRRRSKVPKRNRSKCSQKQNTEIRQEPPCLPAEVTPTREVPNETGGIFSFLKNLWRGRKTEKNSQACSKSSILTKINEVRQLDFCKGQTNPCYATHVKIQQVPDACPSACSACKSDDSDESCGKCYCKPVLDLINDRLTCLEDANKTKKCESNINDFCCKDRKTRNEIRKCQKKMRKKCSKERKKRHKLQKKRYEQECSDCANDMCNAMAFYLSQNTTLRNPSVASAPTQSTTECTTTTTTTTKTTLTTNTESSDCTRHPPKTQKYMRERMSSFLRHLHRHPRESP